MIFYEIYVILFLICNYTKSFACRQIYNRFYFISFSLTNSAGKMTSFGLVIWGPVTQWVAAFLGPLLGVQDRKNDKLINPLHWQPAEWYRVKKFKVLSRWSSNMVFVNPFLSDLNIRNQIFIYISLFTCSLYCKKTTICSCISHSD